MKGMLSKFSVQALLYQNNSKPATNMLVNTSTLSHCVFISLICAEVLIVGKKKVNCYCCKLVQILDSCEGQAIVLAIRSV